MSHQSWPYRGTQEQGGGQDSLRAASTEAVDVASAQRAGGDNPGITPLPGWWHGGLPGPGANTRRPHSALGQNTAARGHLPQGRASAEACGGDLRCRRAAARGRGVRAGAAAAPIPGRQRPGCAAGRPAVATVLPAPGLAAAGRLGLGQTAVAETRTRARRGRHRGRWVSLRAAGAER